MPAFLSPVCGCTIM